MLESFVVGLCMIMFSSKTLIAVVMLGEIGFPYLSRGAIDRMLSIVFLVEQSVIW